MLHILLDSSLCSESLPEEDPETQAVLMKHILEMLMEIENLTPAEKASVQENIANLDPHSLGASAQHGQQRYASTLRQSHRNHD